MSWLRLDEDVLGSKGVVKATSEHGALGAAAWMFVLTKCKRDNRGGGLVEVAPQVMARELNATPEMCAAVITTLATTAALMEIVAGAAADFYIVPNWDEYQPDSRAAGRERAAQGQTGTPKVSQGHTGQRDGTGPNEEKHHSAGGRAPRRGGAPAQRRAASETRQAIIASERALQDLSGEPDA